MKSFRMILDPASRSSKFPGLHILRDEQERGDLMIRVGDNHRFCKADGLFDPAGSSEIEHGLFGQLRIARITGQRTIHIFRRAIHIAAFHRIDPGEICSGERFSCCAASDR